MKIRFGVIPILLLCIVSTFGQSSAGEGYLSWTAAQAEKVGKDMRISDKVGSSFDLRLINTDKAINYKLRATWLTPEVIRASARLDQLRNRLSDEQTRELVAEAENAGDAVFLIEIDPREGSGVIPLDWRVILQPKDLRIGVPGAISGIKSPQLKRVKALSGVLRRDYDYDIFWVVFPMLDTDKKPVFGPDVTQVQLIVGIYGREGMITWQMPESVRTRISALSNK